MAQIPGSVPLTGKVAPTDTLDTFATHMDIYGEGGYMTVADLTERDAISTERRKQGMAAYVNSENKLYVLKNGINNLDWVEFAGGVSLNLQEVFDTGTIAPPLGLTINDSVGILPGNSILMGTGDVVEMITGNWTSPYIPSTYIMQAQPIGYISLQCADGNPGPPNYSSGSIKLKGENVDGTVSLSLRPGGTELYTPNSFDHSLNNGSYSVHNITTYDIESNESIHLNNHTGTWTGAQEIFIENGAQYAQSNLGSSYIKLTEPAVSTGKIEIGTTWDESGVPAPSVYTSKIILGNADQSISLEANGGKAGIGGNIRLAGIGLGTPNIGDVLVAKDITGNLEWATPTFSGNAKNTVVVTGGTATLDLSLGNLQVLDLNNPAPAGAVTLTLSNPSTATSYTIRIHQGLNLNTLVWPGTVKWEGGTPLTTPTQVNGATDMVSMIWDGTNYWASYGTNFN